MPSALGLLHAKIAMERKCRDYLLYGGLYYGVYSAQMKQNARIVLTAIVTLDALNELKVSPGSPCTALIKASHVLVAVND